MTSTDQRVTMNSSLIRIKRVINNQRKEEIKNRNIMTIGNIRKISEERDSKVSTQDMSGTGFLLMSLCSGAL